jgi:hypothetical protein
MLRAVLRGVVLALAVLGAITVAQMARAENPNCPMTCVLVNGEGQCILWAPVCR